MFGGCFFQAKIPAGAGSNCDNIRFMEQGSTIGLLSAQLSPARSEVKDYIASVEDQSNNCLFHFFIGPRCPWGPIYGSGSLSQTN